MAGIRVVAKGKWILVEPSEKSSVLKVEEISTVFEVLSIGAGVDINIEVRSKIVVHSGSIEKAMYGTIPVYYVRQEDVICEVSQEDEKSTGQDFARSAT